MKLRDLIFRVIDVETTGLNPATDRIVAIAARDVGYNGVQGTWLAHPVSSTLVNPGIPIPPEASAVHHIRREKENRGEEKSHHQSHHRLTAGKRPRL